MAKCQMMMPEDFLRKLSTLGSKTDEISEKVLEAGGEVVLAKVKSNLSAVIGSGTAFDSRSTGELERSLGLSPVKVDKNGNHDIKNRFFRTAFRRQQQCKNCKHSRIRQARSKSKAFFEARQKCVQICL